MTYPRVFGLPHLSEDAVAAFADGVLAPAATARAQRHCAECPECADAVRGQREAAMMLRTSAAPALPSGLLDRLAGLPMSTSLPPPRSGLPTMLGSDGIPVFIAHDPSGSRSCLPQPDSSQPSNAQPSNARPDGSRRPPVDGGHDRVSIPEHRSNQHRRGLLPVTLLASVAAVVAAGTLGGNVSAAGPVNEHPAAPAAVRFAFDNVGSAPTDQRQPSTYAPALVATSLEQPQPVGSVEVPLGIHRDVIAAP